jgi:hypothetical protein
MHDNPYINRKAPQMNPDDPAWVSEDEFRVAAVKAQDDYVRAMSAADRRQAESLRRQAEHVRDEQVRAELLAMADALVAS